ncbi:MAG TPA: hypothetical protein PK003_05265 [Bacillota bacterium]|nr:hypothetical protein [Bacillota bacterium]
MNPESGGPRIIGLRLFRKAYYKGGDFRIVLEKTWTVMLFASGSMQDYTDQRRRDRLEIGQYGYADTGGSYYPA